MKNSSQNRAKISPGGLGEALGRPWGELRALEGLWGCFGGYLGSPWDAIGSPLGALWAPFGRPWKPFGDFGEPWGAFLGKSFQGKAWYMILARCLMNFRRFLDVFFSQTVSKT